MNEENEGSLSITPTNTFIFNGDIDQSKTDELMNFLLSQFGSKTSSTILLNTYGGDVYDAFGLANFMQIQKQNIDILCTGKVMSSGLILLTGANNVYSFRDTRFMVHDADIGDSEIKKRNIKTTSQNIHELNAEMYLKIYEYAKETSKNISLSLLKRMGEQETYFSAQEALSLGVIHGII